MRFSEIIDILEKKDAKCKFELVNHKSFILNNIKGFSDWIKIDLDKLNTNEEFYNGVNYNKVKQISIISTVNGEKYNNLNLLDFVNDIISDDYFDYKIVYEYQDNVDTSFSVNDVKNRYVAILNKADNKYKHKLVYTNDGGLIFETRNNKAEVYVDDVYDVKKLNKDNLACPICRKSKTNCSDCEFKQKSELVKTLEYLGL